MEDHQPNWQAPRKNGVPATDWLRRRYLDLDTERNSISNDKHSALSSLQCSIPQHII
jgi:hypothetical protein